jgi:hypothetical protein
VTEAEARKICASADVFVNVSGCGWLRPEYAAIPLKVFIDSDPMFTQVGLLNASPEVRDRVRAHDRHFTFAENIGTAKCRIPDAGFRWLPTRQPVVLDWWQPHHGVGRNLWTTVMNWVSYKECRHEGESWGQKDVEFLRFVELPRRTSEAFQVAMGMGPGKKRPTAMLQSTGWQIIEPSTYLPDPWTYHDYLLTSKGEWSIAKEGYVKSHSGWFSCRSACYLALGRPCVLQDTGWSQIIPAGEGLHAFTNLEEAVAGVEAVAGDFTRHSQAARRLAEDWFDARKVLAALLEAAGS